MGRFGRRLKAGVVRAYKVRAYSEESAAASTVATVHKGAQLQVAKGRAPGLRDELYCAERRRWASRVHESLPMGAAVVAACRQQEGASWQQEGKRLRKQQFE